MTYSNAHVMQRYIDLGNIFKIPDAVHIDGYTVISWYYLVENKMTLSIPHTSNLKKNQSIKFDTAI